MQEERSGTYGFDALPFALYAKAVEEKARFTKASNVILNDNEALSKHISLRTGIVWNEDDGFDVNSSGYVTTKSNGRFVHVPFHLFHAFPFLSSLDELVEIAKHIRIGPSSTICISGSSTCLERLDSIGDIDYCEYASEADLDLTSEIEKTAITDTEALVCIKVKWGDELKVFRPWVDLKSSIEQAHEAIKKDVALSTRNWKLDFVGMTQVVGPVAITNMCLPNETHGSVTARSWIYQEAVINGEMVVSGSLADPTQFGQYVLWLKDSVLEYIDNNPKKAAKRALSLCYLLGFSYEAKLIEEALNDETLVYATRVEALEEVDELLATDTGPSLNDFREASQVKRAELGTKNSNQNSGANSALVLCKQAVKVTMESLDKVMDEANEFLDLSERLIIG